MSDEQYQTTATIPDDVRLDPKPFLYMTSKGTFELVQAIDGDWVRCIQGTPPWHMADWVKIVDDYQQDREDDTSHQLFTASNGMTHDVGVLMAIVQ